ncbi:hypothetical protein Goklo_028190, partial [Gossypium klotzschianum]|nr:hypothetical protein [Gossypium klotzschianum]
NGNTHGILESSGETKKLKELEKSGTTIFIDALGRLVRDVRDKVTSIHFNPAFEDLSIVPMAVNERVPDTTKHIIVNFQENLNQNLVGKTGNNVADNIENCVNWLRFRVVEEILSALKEKGMLSNRRRRKETKDQTVMSLVDNKCEYNEYNPNIISLLEMKVSGFKADAIISKLGLKRSHRVEAVGFSRGIWFGLKEFVDIEIEKEASLKGFEVVYSPRALSLDGNGDFNAILSVEEKKYGHTVGHRCHFFGEFVDMAQLHDLGFRGAPFTCHRVLLFERLGRAFGNDAWLDFSPNFLVTNLPRIKSDHIPILLTLQL